MSESRRSEESGLTLQQELAAGLRGPAHCPTCGSVGWCEHIEATRLGERGWPLDPPELIVVCGSRNYTDEDRIRGVLAEYLPPEPWMQEPTILHGGCRGADKLTHKHAVDLGFWVGEIAADWGKHGRAAGPIRNRQLLDKKPDLVIAFGRGRGTDDTVREARKRGIPVREVDRD